MIGSLQHAPAAPVSCPRALKSTQPTAMPIGEPAEPGKSQSPEPVKKVRRAGGLCGGILIASLQDDVFPRPPHSPSAVHVHSNSSSS